MFRERITITLEPELLAAIDTLIDKQTLRNRSHAIEHLLKEGIGLHQLSQAFIFFEDGWKQNQLQETLLLCSKTGIEELFLSLPAADQGSFVSISATIQEFNTSQEHQIRFVMVPSDFGSGGALVLQKNKISQPFVLFWLNEQFHLPQTLLSAYTFHRQHHALLTQIIHSTEGYFQTSGVAIAQAEIITHIPAGIISLTESVFPTLTQEHNVRAYVIN